MMEEVQQVHNRRLGCSILLRVHRRRHRKSATAEQTVPKSKYPECVCNLNKKGSQIDIAVLDFSKAFDTVPHDGLLSKLKHYGIDDKIWLWISNFLKQRVVVDGIQSDLVTVDSGVPQGTVLGPILFLLHINDLPSVISSKVRLFADDCLVYREIKNRQDQIALQKDLNKT